MNAGELWGYIVGAIGVLFGLASWLRNTKGDASTQAIWMGKVDAKLDTISNELVKLGNVLERVALLERDVKTLFRYHDEAKKSKED